MRTKLSLALARPGALVFSDYFGVRGASRRLRTSPPSSVSWCSEAISTRADRGGAGPRCSATGMAVGA